MKEDWNDFKFFLGVAEQGTLKNAADTLNVNISTVLRRINAFEEKMGATLFDRTHDGFTLTEPGKIMLYHVVSMQEHADGLIRRIKDTDNARVGVIRLTTSDSVFHSHLFSFINAYCDSRPAVNFEFIVSPRDNSLAKREADIALSVGNNQPDNMVGRPLKTVQYRFYALKKHDLKQTTNIGELEKYPILMLNDAFSHQPFSLWVAKNLPHQCFVHRGDKFTTIQQMIKMGLGIGLLPDYLGDNDTQLNPLFTLPEEANKELWLLIHPDLRKIQRIRDFMDATYSYFSALSDNAC